MNAFTPVGDTSAERFSPDNPNILLWLSQEQTDPKFTKPITGKQYKGTSPNPTYVMKRLTAAFGPVGWGWGYRILSCEDVAAGDTITNFVHIEFWYYPFGRADASEQRRAVFEQLGGTQFTGGNRKPDEDVRKKSLTDALTKAASHIGIAGDIFLGRYEDSKYLDATRHEEERAASPLVFVEASGGGERRFLDVGEWKTFWRDRLKVMAEDKNFAAAEPLLNANNKHIGAVAERDAAAACWVTAQLDRMINAARAAEQRPGDGETDTDGDGDAGDAATGAPPEELPLARSDGTVDHARAKNGLSVDLVWLSWVRARIAKAANFGQLKAWWDLNGGNIGIVQKWFPDAAAAAAKAYTDGLADLSDFPGDRESRPAMAGAK